MLLSDLFWSFGKAGIFGFGGGPSMIPLIQNQVVDARSSLTREEFLDVFGNTLRGPTTTKLAGYIGYKVKGWGGATMGLLGMTVPTILAPIVLASVYLRFRDSSYITGFLHGVRAIVSALLALVVYEFVPCSFRRPDQRLGTWLLWGLALLAFVPSVHCHVHPALLIFASSAFGLVFFL